MADTAPTGQDTTISQPQPEPQAQPQIQTQPQADLDAGSSLHMVTLPTAKQQALRLQKRNVLQKLYAKHKK